MTFLVAAASIGHARRFETLVSPDVNPLYAVGLDAGGNLYVFRPAESRVVRITPAGVATDLIGPSGDGLGNIYDCPGNFSLSCTMLVTAGGDVYVTGAASDNVFHIDPVGTVTEVIDSSGDGLGHVLLFPITLALDPSGNLFVAGASSANVFKVTPGGAISQIVGNLDAFFPRVASDTSGNVFISEENRVLRYDTTGTLTTMIDVQGDGSGNPFVSFVPDPVLDAAGNLYVSGEGTDNLFKVAPDGTVTLLIDASGDGLGNGLNEPRTPAVDSQGTVYVTGFQPGNVFRIDTGGAIASMASVERGFATKVDENDQAYLLEDRRVSLLTAAGARPIFDEQGDGVPSEPYVNDVIVTPGVSYLTILDGQFYRVVRLELLCNETARAGCRRPVSPLASKLIVKDVFDDSRDAVVWKWTRGAATDLSAFGNPADLDYSLCIYDAAGLRFEASAVAGATCPSAQCWSPRPGTGHVYLDTTQKPDGVRKIQLRAGADGKSKVSLKVSGANRPEGVAIPADLPLTAQLQASNGECWEAVYAPGDVLKNEPPRLVAKGH